MSLDDLYQEVLLDHFRNPRCHGCVTNPSGEATLVNPLCGDQVVLTVRVANNAIEDLAFGGHGCSISQASASMMAEACKGRPVVEARALADKFRALMRGEKQAEDLPELGDVAALQGVRKFSARVKCALLAWEALDKCLEKSV
ncbi:MAG: SUF system NifU family Fe-S cluster assembly protein [Proteobacteria bacterium]|nr:SUF system NifU family Fe-S cluster assembly protein [Pseudomonadota bacterium]